MPFELTKILQEELDRPIRVTVDGVEKTLPALELIILKLEVSRQLWARKLLLQYRRWKSEEEINRAKKKGGESAESPLKTALRKWMQENLHPDVVFEMMRGK
jgi:hypothetical protein